MIYYDTPKQIFTNNHHLQWTDDRAVNTENMHMDLIARYIRIETTTKIHPYNHHSIPHLAPITAWIKWIQEVQLTPVSILHAAHAQRGWSYVTPHQSQASNAWLPSSLGTLSLLVACGLQATCSPSNIKPITSVCLYILLPPREPKPLEWLEKWIPYSSNDMPCHQFTVKIQHKLATMWKWPHQEWDELSE